MSNGYHVTATELTRTKQIIPSWIGWASFNFGQLLDWLWSTVATEAKNQTLIHYKSVHSEQIKIYENCKFPFSLYFISFKTIEVTKPTF